MTTRCLQHATMFVEDWKEMRTNETGKAEIGNVVFLTAGEALKAMPDLLRAFFFLKSCCSGF